MRQRITHAVVGALALSALAAGLSGCGRMGTGNFEVFVATDVSTTITIDPSINEIFAPPPADASPALTPDQAVAQYAKTSGGTQSLITSGDTVQLGLLTFPVGPYCGAECDGYVVENGIAYHALNELAYGYSSSTCSSGPTSPAADCTSWVFLDAITGKFLGGTVPWQGGPVRWGTPTPTPSSPAG